MSAGMDIRKRVGGQRLVHDGAVLGLAVLTSLAAARRENAAGASPP